MAAEKCAAEVWVAVDDAGDYAVGTSAADATENYENNVQAVSDASGWRMVKLTVNVPLPVPVEAVVDVPEVEGEPTVSVG